MGILIIDDREEPRRLLEQLLRRAGFDVSFWAGSPADISEFPKPDADPAGTGPSVDLILLDLHAPGPVIETIKRLRQHPRHHDLPIVLITATADSPGIAEALGAGADDFIVAPVRPLELAARVRTALRLKQETDRRKAREAELQRLNQRLAATGRDLERLAFLDGLTGIPNRRYFDEVYAREWGRAAREGHALGLILSDIDHFKRYNDTRGHQQGDACLRRVAAALAGTIKRPADFVARYGGEEFCAAAGNRCPGHRIPGRGHAPGRSGPSTASWEQPGVRLGDLEPGGGEHPAPGALVPPNTSGRGGPGVVPGQGIGAKSRLPPGSPGWERPRRAPGSRDARNGANRGSQGHGLLGP